MLQKLHWNDVRETIHKDSPDFVKIIDDLDPNPKDGLYFYLINYAYGSIIVDHGTFQIPNSDKQIVPINHSSIPHQIKDDLGYSGTVPFGFITENCIEAFMYSNKRIIPSSLVKKGQFISLWRVLDEGVSYHTGKFWNITSGTRSICMIPKITDTKNHKNLKMAYHLKNNVPEQLFDNWDLFVKIANHRDFTQPWKSTILFFPKQWFEYKKDMRWAEFYRYLLNIVWQGSSFRRNQFIFDFAFSLAQENRGLRPNPYIADIVRHLIAIGSGAVPGFTPAIDDSAAPISGLQHIYLDKYELKKYAPVIMHAHYFTPRDQQVGYYSFQMPTTIIFSPRSRKKTSAMRDINETQHIMEVLFTEILRGNLEVENTPLFWLAENIKYNFYHSDKDKSGIILPACKIEQLDTNFTKALVNNNNYMFPEFSSFFKGCISISSPL
jgi:hypothetical protein